MYLSKFVKTLYYVNFRKFRLVRSVALKTVWYKYMPDTYCLDTLDAFSYPNRICISLRNELMKFNTTVINLEKALFG